MDCAWSFRLKRTNCAVSKLLRALSCYFCVVNAVDCCLLLGNMLVSFIVSFAIFSFPRPPFLRDAFGIRSGCAPSPMRHAPCTFTLPSIFPSSPSHPSILTLIHRYSVLIHLKSRLSSKKFPKSFAVKPKVRTFALAFRKGSPSDKRMDL